MNVRDGIEGLGGMFAHDGQEEIAAITQMEDDDVPLQGDEQRHDQHE